MTDDDPPSTVSSLDHPTDLYDCDDVPSFDHTRDLAGGQFERMREHHATIDGVVGVGVRDGGALLMVRHGDGGWAPTGGQVQPGEDWADAARRGVLELTGQAVDLEAVKRVEHITFRREDGDGTFETDSVLFRATLADPAPSFREDPTPAADRPADYPVDLGWFETVPDDVNPNHEDHVRLLLD
jgi:ADP-ribose pyrophosphatase YjhB (NUDIX family)